MQRKVRILFLLKITVIELNKISLMFVIKCTIVIIFMRQRRQSWSDFQDRAITTLVKKYGTRNWAQISEKMSSKYGIQNRTGKQCRQRWNNHLDPDLSKDAWSYQQEKLMFQAHQLHGNKWTQISKLFPGRTDNDIKNHFYSMLRRSLRRVNKLLGMPNSTKKIRLIKPSVLSKVFTHIGVADSHKSNQCRKIAQALYGFSRSKRGQQGLGIEQRRQLQELIERLQGFNQEYEANVLVKRDSSRNSKKKESKRQEDSQQSQQQEQEKDRQNSKIQFRVKGRQKINVQKQFQVEVSTPRLPSKTGKTGRKKQSKPQKYPTLPSSDPTISLPQKKQQQALASSQSFPLSNLMKRSSNSSLSLQDQPILFSIASPLDIPRCSSSSSSNRQFVFTSPKMDMALFSRTPQIPTPNIFSMFQRGLVNFDGWKISNQQLDCTVNQTKKNIERNT